MYSRLSSSQHAASYTHTDYTNEAYIYVVNICTGNSRFIGQNAAVQKTIFIELRTFCTDPVTHSVDTVLILLSPKSNLQNKEFYYKR